MPTKNEVQRFIGVQVKKSFNRNKFFSSLATTPCNSTALIDEIGLQLAANVSLSTTTFAKNGLKRNSLSKNRRHNFSSETRSDVSSSNESEEKILPPSKRKCLNDDFDIGSSNRGFLENGKDKSIPKRISVLSSTVSMVRNSGRPKLRSPKHIKRHKSKSKSPILRKKHGQKLIPKKNISVRNEKEKFTFFFTKKYPFSNHYPCLFIINNKTFTCTEQYYMYQKALTFGDDRAANQILGCNEPKKMKLIGSRIVGFVQSKWDLTSEKVMFVANYEKYSQNRDLRLALFVTEGTTLVETNPSDQRWGIGLSMNDPRANSTSTWRGKNLLGRILTEIRDNLMQDDKFMDDVTTARKHPTKYLWWKNDGF